LNFIDLQGYSNPLLKRDSLSRAMKAGTRTTPRYL